MERGFRYLPTGVRVTRDQLERIAAATDLSTEAVLARIRLLDPSLDVIEYPDEPFWVACGSADEIGGSIWTECEYCGARICHDPAFPANARFICISCVPLAREDDEKREKEPSEQP